MKTMPANVIRLGVGETPSGPKLEEHPILKALGGQPEIRERNTIHFDTLDLKLHRKRALVTLDRDGLEWSQTVARGDGDSTAAHWRRMRVKNGRLNEKKLKKLDTDGLLAGIKLSKLKPLFVLHGQERVWTLDFPEKVELTLREESGYLLIGGIRHPFREIVLESPSGHHPRLFETGLALAYHLESVILLCSGPVGRGFARLDGDLAALMPVGPVTELEKSISVRGAFVQLGRALLDALQASRVTARHGGGKSRWAGYRRLLWTVDRLRTLIAIYHAHLPAEIRVEMETEVRWLLDGLTRVRDWQRFFRNTLEPLIGQFPFQAGLDDLHRRGEESREIVFQSVAGELDSFRFARLLLGLSQWMAADDSHRLLEQPQSGKTSAAKLAREALNRHTLALGQRDRTLAAMDIGERRALRQDVERLNHTVDLFSPLFPNKRAAAFREALGTLTRSLGFLEDTATGRELFDGLLKPGEETLGHLLQGWAGARTDRFIRDSDRAWRQFVDCPPFWK